jgi:hypothetical protein
MNPIAHIEDLYAKNEKYLMFSNIKGDVSILPSLKKEKGDSTMR